MGKTLANCVVSEQFVQVVTRKVSVEYEGKSFNREIEYQFLAIHENFALKDSCTVDVYIEFVFRIRTTIIVLYAFTVGALIMCLSNSASKSDSKLD